jgi:fluoroquinolone transport system permease protein
VGPHLPAVRCSTVALGVPALDEWLRVRAAFDLAPYHPLIAGSYALVAPSGVGFVGGFLLLDQRDDRILDAIRVTPVSVNTLLVYRLGAPLIIGGLITIVGYPLIGFVPLASITLIVATALSACVGPMLALLLTGFADNKVTGFALTKLFSAVANFALVAWFLPMPWQVAAGVVPSYWPMKMVWQAAAGRDMVRVRTCRIRGQPAGARGAAASRPRGALEVSRMNHTCARGRMAYRTRRHAARPITASTIPTSGARKRVASAEICEGATPFPETR